MTLKDEFKQELERIGKDLRSLGSSIKSKAQSANRGVKNAWSEIEPKIAKFETEASVATDKAVADLKKSGGDLITQLKGIKDKLTSTENDGGGEEGDAAGAADEGAKATPDGEAPAEADASEPAEAESDADKPSDG